MNHNSTPLSPKLRDIWTLEQACKDKKLHYKAKRLALRPSTTEFAPGDRIQNKPDHGRKTNVSHS